jgi:hypothetical protein
MEIESHRMHANLVEHLTRFDIMQIMYEFYRNLNKIDHIQISTK